MKGIIRLCGVIAASALALAAAPRRQVPVVDADGTRLSLPKGARLADQIRPATTPMTASQHTAFMKSIVPKLGSGLVATRLAEKYGMIEMAGKRLIAPSKGAAKPAAPSPLAGFDVHVSRDPLFGSQNEPSIAVNPVDPYIVVAFSHNDNNLLGVPNACSIYLSTDAGTSFSYLLDAPLTSNTPPNVFCSDPVVRFSPDGSVVSFSYMDINDATGVSNIRLHRRDGFSLASIGTSTPFPDPGSGAFLDKNWHDVHTFDAADGNADGAGFVYATVTIFGDLDSDLVADDCGILLNRSSNFGASWDFGAGALIDQSIDCDPVLQGSRPAGAPGQQVLVCYYDSGTDGWSPGFPATERSNKFNIICQSSADRMNTISGLIFAASNIANEAPFWLGPNANFHRWWGTMFPSLSIDHQGTAHVVFGADPTSNQLDKESGNVWYIQNKFPDGLLTVPFPYDNKWTGKKPVGSGPFAQGWGTITTQMSNSQPNPIVYVAYADHNNSKFFGKGNENLVYDVMYRVATKAPAFKKATRATEASSRSDFIFIGDYFDSATDFRSYHVIWTDRSRVFDIFDLDDDVYYDKF